MTASSSEELILEKMSELGFNKYEAKTYMTLIEHQEISAYEISKRSGVPQSKIYETVNRLVEEGFVISQGENPVLYSALPLAEFINRHRTRIESSLTVLEEELKKQQEQPEVDYMWHLKGRQSCFEKVREVIDGAENRLLIEVWEEELDEIIPFLDSAVESGVNILQVYYGEREQLPGRVYHHRMEGMQEEAREKGRWLTAVADRQEAFFGSFGQQKPEAVWTQNQAFMMMAENFITHDIFIAEIYNSIPERIQELFGPNLEKLREELDIWPSS